MRNFLLYVCLFLLILVGIAVYNTNSHITIPNPSATPTPAPWQPARLRIPALHVDAPVLNVGLTATGDMDAPVSKAVNSPFWTSVFWYAGGTAPGQTGSAVLAGHVDRVGGDPAIFWSLGMLKPGDKVFIITYEQKTLQFVVERLASYPINAPGKDVLNAVFGPTPEHHLNLITCTGVWTGNTYNQRLVVFTTQVNS
jgi:Sortase domain